MKEIIFENITKIYGKDTLVLDKINLEIQPGERVILLGASGCGKSTTLRIIAGLETITDGKLVMNERVVNDVSPEERSISMVFQNYALYPHMTVRENIEYALKLKKEAKSAIKRKSDQVIEILRLDGLDQRRPKDLSGGQRQRVALARALVKNTDYLLLDEPLSNLDAQLRLHARQELVRIHNKFAMTMVYVTHDQIEAMTVAQKIVLLDKGSIQMIGTPYEIYHKPANVFTAKFIGSPPMNIIPMHYEDLKLVIGDNLFYKVDDRLRTIIEENGNANIFLGIRPERIQIAQEASENTVPVQISYVENYGSRTSVYFDLEGESYNLIVDRMDLAIGDQISLIFPHEEVILFDGKTEKNIMCGR